jgi:hypothetical protein
MNSVLNPRLPWRPAALIAGAVLAAVLAVAPAHASQAPARPALAGNGAIHTDSNGVINTDGNGVIRADGIQGSGA